MEPQQGLVGSQPSVQVQVLPKYSRYRSVRQAAARQQQEVNKTAESQIDPSYPISCPATTHESQNASTTAKPHNGTIARSMSRYKRAKPPTVSSPPLPTSRPSLPELVNQPRVETSNVGGVGTGASRQVSNPETRSRGGHSAGSQATRYTDDEEEDAATRERWRREAMERLTAGEKNQTTHERRPTTRAPKEEVNRDQQREKGTQAGHATERPTNGKRSASNESKRVSWKGRMGLLRSKGHDNSRKEAAEAKDTARNDSSSGRNIEPGGGGIVPGIDAPVSAVNAGERKVLVQCNESFISLPVTPTTQARDIVYSASNCLSERIDPKKSVLVEAFSQLGLERPLRKYEHVRDVLNSWDSDGQNSLIILPSPSISALDELDAKAVLQVEPHEATFYIYHSQRPGKWDKRYVTLRIDGQVVVAKKPGHEPTNICHLSDFDIYSPTPRQLSKKIKPPKKMCFAVKSQQKSSMFLSTENFVHFFSTNDQDVAANWYKAVQRWRSWYLVNVLGEGQKLQDTSQTSNQATGTYEAPHSPQHERGIPTESTPYQLGSFKPLLDMASFERDQETSARPVHSQTTADATSASKTMYAHKKSSRGHAHPPPSFPKQLSVDTDNVGSQYRSGAHVKGYSSEDTEDSTFSPTGLLGRTYSQRQRAMRKREEKNSDEGPFSPHGLLSNLGPTTSAPSSHHPFSNPSSRGNSRTNTMGSMQAPDLGNCAPKRSTSVRQNTKPLVDLSPVYQEPPQHARKGRGVAVAPGVPLVDVATSPELPGAIVVPSATTWRRPGQQVASPSSDETSGFSHAATGTRRRSNTTHSHTHAQFQSLSNVASPTSAGSSVTSPDNPFAPNSLLARSTNVATAQGGSNTGHGVATGSRKATRPLLDLEPQSQFAEGSLLRNLEAS